MVGVGTELTIGVRILVGVTVGTGVRVGVGVEVGVRVGVGLGAKVKCEIIDKVCSVKTQYFSKVFLKHVSGIHSEFVR